MHSYKAFGISVKSEISIPQFALTENRQFDVSIKFGNVKALLPRDIGDDRAVQISEEEICFYWDQIGLFLVRDGSEIIIEPDSGAEEKLLRLPLIGIALAALLQQRGMLVLHASAVSIGAGAVAFLGWKGRGKSTTAAMLYRRGHPVISDDIVAMENIETGIPSIVPGFPNFKLMPETAVSVLGDNPDALSECYTGAEKRFRPFSDNFLRESVPLKAIYVLEDGEKLKAEMLKPQDALTTLIANTFLARYGKQLLQNKQAMANLRQCSNVVNYTPVYRLERPRSLDLLEDLAQLIESQCQSEPLSRIT